MQLEYEFTVPVPVSQAWAVLLDVEQVAPCVPGATLTSFDGDAFAGTVKVRMGPVSLTYQGKGRFVSRDKETGEVVIEASGRDARGAGTVATTATMRLKPADAVQPEGAATSTVVSMVADLSVTGRPAQFGRGMIGEVGGKLVGQFADCLAQRLAESPPAVPAEASESAAQTPAPEEPPVPVAGPASPGLRSEATREGDASEGPATRASGASASTTAQPVDLFKVGAGPVLRRVAPFAIGFVAGALVTWVVMTWLG